MSTPCRLDGCGVLVTRPKAQAENLCRLISEAGGTPVAFPTLEIRPARDLETPRQQLAEPYDLILFVSRNAAEHGLKLLPPQPTRPGSVRAPEIGAVGRATADALAALGVPPSLVPDSGFDSEALLALPELTNVAGRRVLIVRGEGGRALLGDTLRERGAEVRFAEVYRRAIPDVDVGPRLAEWERELAFITATSDEVLHNLYTLIGTAGRKWLLKMPLVVISERGGSSAMQLGFRTVAVAKETSDLGILEALCRLAFTRQSVC